MGNVNLSSQRMLSFAVGNDPNSGNGGRSLLLSRATPGAFFADATLGYRGSGASVGVDPGTWFRAGDHVFEIADPDVTDHQQTTAIAVRPEPRGHPTGPPAVRYRGMKSGHRPTIPYDSAKLRTQWGHGPQDRYCPTGVGLQAKSRTPSALAQEEYSAL